MRRPRLTRQEFDESHPYIHTAFEKLRQGRVSRREFLRLATLLGMSAGSAAVLAACSTPATEAPPVDDGGTTDDGGEEVVATEEVMEEPMGPPRGGTLRVATQVKAVDHPARFSWIFDANQFRHVFEYLSETGSDNITRPYLLESWEANEDLTVWTLNVRQGVNWTNGEALTAEHIAFNFGEWLNPDVGSSILGLWDGFLTMDGLQIVDAGTLQLNLSAPLLAVPEQLFHYPGAIVHPSFDGNVTSGANTSTGPMLLDEFTVGERVRAVSRYANGDEGYWQMGEDGHPLPYLDAIEWVDLGEDQTAAVAALQSGQIDNIYDPSVDSFLALRGDSSLAVASVGTASTRVLRFRVDLEPWTDNRAVRAVTMLQDRQKITDQAYFGEGDLGADTHVAPAQAEYAPMDIPDYDPDGAAALLDEAGLSGLELSVSVGTGWTDIVAYMETLKEDAIAAGVDITLDTMPNASYWDLWVETAVGVTTWAHRPLAVMLLPLAYIADTEGNPVPWNETRWVDEEFNTLLKEAQGTFDVEARRALMVDIQRIQATRGSIGVSYFTNRWAASNPAFIGVQAHPTGYNLWREVYYDAEMDPFN